MIRRRLIPALSLLLLALPAVGWGAPPDRAALIKQGRAESAAGDHDKALASFQQAATLRSDAKVLSLIAREYYELLNFDQAEQQARGCLSEIETGTRLDPVPRAEVALSCHWLLASSLFQRKQLAAAGTAASACLKAAREDSGARNRDKVTEDCEKLEKSIAVLTPKVVPLYKRKPLWIGLGLGASVALGLGLGLGLRPPADPTAVRSVEFSLSF